MPDPPAIVLHHVDLKGYLFGISRSLANKTGLITDQTAEVRYGNKIWTGKVIVISTLSPDQENKFLLNPNMTPEPLPPDHTMLSLLAGPDGLVRLGPVLGILSYRTGKSTRLFGEQTSFLKKLIRAGRAMNMVVYIFSPLEVNWELGVISGYSLCGTGANETWRQLTYPFPDVFYDRGLFPPGPPRRAASEFRKAMRPAAAGKYFNPAFFGKWKTHRWFMKQPALCRHLPETVLAENEIAAFRLLNHHQEVYLKPVGGSSGRGIIKITRLANEKYFYECRINGRPWRSPELGAAELSTALHPTLAARKHIAQQGIKLAKYQERTFDVRALVQKNSAGNWELTGMAARVAAQNAYITNVHAGGQAVKITTVLCAAFSGNPQLQQDILLNLRQLALKACTWMEERTGLKFGEIAVDLGVGTDGYIWFIELNAVPGRTVFRRIGEMATAGRALIRPLEYARFLAGFSHPQSAK